MPLKALFRTSLFLLSIVGAAETHASPSADYSLFLPQNSTYVDFPFERFRSGIKTDEKFLSYYLCDGRSEFEVFRALPFGNSLRDSLRVQPTPKEEILFYRDGKFFHRDGTAATKLKGEFYRQLAGALSALEKIPSGRKMLGLLESSRYPLVITYGTWMTYDATRDGKSQSSLPVATGIMFARESRISTEFAPIDQLGVGGKIVWDPASKVKRMEIDGAMRSVPNFVTLSHEMFHAYDGIRGLLDRRIIFPPNLYESTEVGEYRAMYFENTVRRESGISYAVHYGTYKFEEPGLLDHAGNPIWFPTPCLDP